MLFSSGFFFTLSNRNSVVDKKVVTLQLTFIFVIHCYVGNFNVKTFI